MSDSNLPPGVSVDMLVEQMSGGLEGLSEAQADAQAERPAERPAKSPEDERDRASQTHVPGPGLHTDVGWSEYFGIHLPSGSDLTWARVSCEHMKASLDGQFEEKDTPALQFGRALHCKLLEPATFAQRYLVSGPCSALLKSGARKGDMCGCSSRMRIRGSWYCGKHGREEEADYGEVISQDHGKRVAAAADKVKAHDVVHMLRRQGGFEVTAIAEIDGVMLKGRLDKWIPDDGEVPPTIATDVLEPGIAIA